MVDLPLRAQVGLCTTVLVAQSRSNASTVILRQVDRFDPVRRCRLAGVESPSSSGMRSGTMPASREARIDLSSLLLGSYLLLVDYSGWLLCAGKARTAPALGEILDRLGSSAESRQARLQKLCGSRLLGRFFAVTAGEKT